MPKYTVRDHGDYTYVNDGERVRCYKSEDVDEAIDAVVRDVRSGKLKPPLLTRWLIKLLGWLLPRPKE